MAEKIIIPDRTVSFEYMLFDGDPDDLRTVVATPTQMSPWIEAAELKLKHRIGRGTFGDVWLATHHQFADDFEEYHEVAVKVLHPLKEDLTQMFVDRFERIFLRSREMQGVGWLHGVSIMNGQVIFSLVNLVFFFGNLFRISVMVFSFIVSSSWFSITAFRY